MSSRVEIALGAEPITRIDVPLAVVGFFSDERPLRGSAGQADWRLCGFVSELIAAGRIEGQPGEAVLVPTGGRLRAERLMLLGLGQRAEFRAGHFEAVTKVALERSVALGMSRLAMAPMGIALGALEAHAEPLVRAVLSGIEGASAPVAIALPVEGESHARIQAALEDAARRLGVLERIAVERPPRAELAPPAGPPAL